MKKTKQHQIKITVPREMQEQLSHISKSQGITLSKLLHPVLTRYLNAEKKRCESRKEQLLVDKLLSI